MLHIRVRSCVGPESASTHQEAYAPKLLKEMQRSSDNNVERVLFVHVEESNAVYIVTGSPLGVKIHCSNDNC